MRRSQMRARIRACDFFCIIDTLTSASMLPGVGASIDASLKRVVGTDHDRKGNMSSYTIGGGASPIRSMLGVMQTNPQG